jgi:hypothetical protein
VLSGQATATTGGGGAAGTSVRWRETLSTGRASAAPEYNVTTFDPGAAMQIVDAVDVIELTIDGRAVARGDDHLRPHARPT